MLPRLLCLFTFGLCVLLAQPVAPPVVEPATAPPISYTVLARKIVRSGDRTVIYNRVLPPVLPARPAAAQRLPTAEELEIAERQERKVYAQISINADVRATPTGPVSILTWWHEGKSYRAYTNADFRLLTVVTHIETEDTLYSWFGIVCGPDSPANPLRAADSDEGVSDLPADLKFAAGFSEYLVDGVDAEISSDPAGAFIGVEVLLAYYDAHKAALAQVFAKREAANAERLRQLRDNPPKKADTVINFWKLPAGENSQASGKTGATP